MSTITPEQIKRIAAQRAASSSKQRQELTNNNLKRSFSSNSMLVYPLDLTHSDPKKLDGTIFGYTLSSSGERQYVEIKSNLTPENRLLVATTKEGEIHGALFDSKFKEKFFKTEGTNRAREVIIQDPKFITDNSRFPKDLYEKVHEHYGVERQVILLLDNPVKVGSRKGEVDGETVTIEMYTCGWANSVPMGAITTNNVYNNALFSFKRLFRATSASGENGYPKPILSAIDSVIVWSPEQPAFKKAIAFSDKKGVDSIYALFDESHTANDYFHSLEGSQFDSLYERTEYNTGRINYKPVVLFGIIDKMSETDDTSALKKQPTSKWIAISRSLLSTTGAWKPVVDENGELVIDEETGLPVIEDIVSVGDDGTEYSVQTVMSREDFEAAMEQFKLDVKDPEQDIHKAIIQSYPDFDFDVLTDDNFVMIGGKSFGMLGNMYKDIKKWTQEFEDILTNTDYTEQQKANIWNNHIEEIVTEKKNNRVRQLVSFYDYDGKLYENENSTPAIKPSYAIRAAMERYRISPKSDLYSAGILRGMRGIVVGSNLTMHEGVVYFNATASSVKPYNYNKVNILSSYYAPDYDGNEEDGALYLPKEMFVVVERTAKHENEHEAHAENGNSDTRHAKSATKDEAMADDDMIRNAEKELFEEENEVAPATNAGKKAVAKKAVEPEEVAEEVEEESVTDALEHVDSLGMDDDIPF